MARQSWNLATVHAVHLAFLRAEWHRIPWVEPCDRYLIDAAELTSVAENERRQQLLYSLRKPLMQEVPEDTIWYAVQYLEPWHLGELRVIRHCGWDNVADQNELPEVAKRRPVGLSTLPDRWSEPILLWGHNRKGPFTILEGNHRLVAYAATPTPPMIKMPVFIGLSPSHCFWHLPDPITWFLPKTNNRVHQLLENLV